MCVFLLSSAGSPQSGSHTVYSIRSQFWLWSVPVSTSAEYIHVHVYIHTYVRTSPILGVLNISRIRQKQRRSLQKQCASVLLSKSKQTRTLKISGI